MIHGTIYEAEGHGGGGGDALFCVIIAWLSIIAWITFAWGGGGHGRGGGTTTGRAAAATTRRCSLGGATGTVMASANSVGLTFLSV
ncbi:hypothetical protein QJS10_CPA08g01891 [Acorus calamus]|uniref:Uncharacterized protein n=1 Tax=Acorus calamus TaxID=4465 RepID=A0AAV9EE65_ACOCL|nr:hypothetical protein QJS10_CPA08g01891 [Acorus calamus]